MKVLLVRHAEAAGAGIGGDRERPLTGHGHSTAARLSDALRARGIALDALFASPLLRAEQTAAPLKRLLADAASQFSICDALASGSHDPAAVCRAIGATNAQRVGVVGHLPDIAELAGHLLGVVGGAIEFDRGTASWLDCGSSPQPGCAALEWLITPEWY
jgi:phosphohistidine phosphatase